MFLFPFSPTLCDGYDGTCVKTFIINICSLRPGVFVSGEEGRSTVLPAVQAQWQDRRQPQTGDSPHTLPAVGYDDVFFSGSRVRYCETQPLTRLSQHYKYRTYHHQLNYKSRPRQETRDRISAPLVFHAVHPEQLGPSVFQSVFRGPQPAALRQLSGHHSLTLRLPRPPHTCQGLGSLQKICLEYF